MFFCVPFLLFRVLKVDNQLKYKSFGFILILNFRFILKIIDKVPPNKLDIFKIVRISPIFLANYYWLQNAVYSKNPYWISFAFTFLESIQFMQI